MLRTIFLILSVLVLCQAAPPRGRNQDGKIFICHYTPGAGYLKLHVSINGANGHLKRHENDFCAIGQDACPQTSPFLDEDCGCVPGYTGDLCQTNIDECGSNPCQNGGACTDGVNGYTCSCVPGYTGDLCQTNIDECGSNPCQNGGTCTDGVNGYTCSCPSSHNGENCETPTANDCFPNPCQNGGTCTNAGGVDDGQFTCDCTVDFTGSTCSDCVSGAFPCGGGCCDFGQQCVNNVCQAPPSECLLYQIIEQEISCTTDCPRTCKEILQANPSAQSGVYRVDADGPGGAEPFNVLCDMDLDGGGWTLVGYEPRGHPSPANGWGIMGRLNRNGGASEAHAIATQTGAGFIGPRFEHGTTYNEGRLNWCDPTSGAADKNKFQIFRTPEDLFGDTVRNTQATTIRLTDFVTNDAYLNTLVTNPDDARFCRANVVGGSIQYGDTSWGVKGSADNFFNCGCNSGSWAGVGSYYGGAAAGVCNRCACWGGQFAGSRSHGQQKGTIVNSNTHFWVR